jgi:hypothetical protein
MQIKNSFDDETKQKIKKSFLFYGIPTAIIAGISYYLKTQNIVESILAGVIGLSSSIINMASEYSSGVEKANN